MNDYIKDKEFEIKCLDISGGLAAIFMLGIFCRVAYWVCFELYF